jgi:DNA-binding MarR family transcriptional regulator
MDAAQRSWRIIRDLVLDDDRRKAVADAFGLSFVRVKALLRLLDGPLTMRELAARLATDAPYTTLIVDDLEQRGLVARSVDARDRRAKIVTVTEAGADLARRAEQLLDVPPAALRELPADDLAVLERVLSGLHSSGSSADS